MKTNFTRKTEFSVVIPFLFCICLIQSTLIIPSIYYGFECENLSCQKGTRGGINLSEWTKGFGLEKTFLNLFISLCSIMFIYTEINEVFLFVPALTIILDWFFNSIWFIWGIVILATGENSSCVKNGESIAILAIVNLCLSPLWYLHIKFFGQLLSN
jgi:hypothetical protein